MIPCFTRILEKVSSQFPSLTKGFIRYYEPVIEEEIRLGEISREDKILFIGGGAIPATAYGIHGKTGASIDVIDIDPCAVRCAEKLTEKLGLSKGIRVFKEDGKLIDTKGYTVVLIALQACPQREIVQNALINGKDGTRVIVRCPSHGLQSVYDTSIDDLDCFSKEKGKSRTHTMSGSLLFVVDRLKHKKSFKPMGV